MVRPTQQLVRLGELESDGLARAIGERRFVEGASNAHEPGLFGNSLGGDILRVSEEAEAFDSMLATRPPDHRPHCLSHQTSAARFPAQPEAHRAALAQTNRDGAEQLVALALGDRERALSVTPPGRLAFGKPAPARFVGVGRRNEGDKPRDLRVRTRRDHRTEVSLPWRSKEDVTDAKFHEPQRKSRVVGGMALPLFDASGSSATRLQYVSWSVRAARGSDAEGIAAVHVDSWRAAYRGLVPDELLDRLSVKEREAKWRELLAVGSGLVLVAEVDGLIGGFCSAELPSRDQDTGPHVAELSAVYVAPELWRRGVGTALVRAAADELCSRDYSEATLWVFAANSAGRAFYSALGWQFDGTEDFHERSGRSTVRLRAELTAQAAAP